MKRLDPWEDGLCITGLLLMALLPLAEIVVRQVYWSGVPGSSMFTRHLVLWVTFLGAAIAARKGELLCLSTTVLLKGGILRFAQIVSSGATFSVCTVLAVASLVLVRAEREGESVIALGIPVWVAQIVMPVGFCLIALRALLKPDLSWKVRLLAGCCGLFPLALWAFPFLEGRTEVAATIVVLLLFATVLGAPIFVALGGIALALQWANQEPLATIPSEAYTLSTDPVLPSIPLFTLAGYILAEGGTPRRLIQVFRALFGWMPGGVAIVSILVCAFFTSFTGGSGVTILALGGLLFPMLVRERYPERFSTGLLTSAGSLGLLLPPSLAVILYAYIAKLEYRTLFMSGVLPASIELILVAAFILLFSRRIAHGRVPFDLRKAFLAVRSSVWELAIPVALIGSILSGLATLVEASAVAVLYALVLEFLVRKELGFKKDLLRVAGSAVTLIGGVMIILGVARGLAMFLIIAQVPDFAVQWVQTIVSSRLFFLLLLNIFLLVVGCMMDIYSAITVVVPLVIPVGMAFGVDPYHLGIIFLVNLELGYLTPPVGMNLFLSSYRFNRPLTEVYSATVPFLLIRLTAVLLITYVPFLTSFLPRLFLSTQQ